MSAEEVARAHYQARHRLTDAVSALARQLWRQVHPSALDSSWAGVAPRMLIATAGAQLAAARMSDGYVGDALDGQDLSPDASASVVPETFAGVASDGRPLDSLLQNPITVVKSAIGAGAALGQAMAAGYANLDMIVRTQVADAGRVADQVSLVAHRSAHGYVRMVNAGACGRCVVLAGKFYKWNAGFLRHPSCHCVNVPAAEDHLDDVRTDPRKFFDSLSSAEQDKQFTKAGAQAIRDGADIGQVINARRGAFGLTPAGARITDAEAKLLRGGREIGHLQTQRIFGQDLFVTTEGTTVRGQAGKRLAAGGGTTSRAGARYRSAKAPRLMPESIYKIAGDDREEALRLLRRNGYLRDAPPRRIAAPRPVAVVKTFDERLAVAARDEAALGAPKFGLGRGPIRPARFNRTMSRAAETYSGAAYAAVNKQLRGLPLPYGYDTDYVLPLIDGIDKAMALSHLARDIVTYRGVLNAEPMFGARLGGNLTGMVWREHAYVSTSALQQRAEFFRRSGTGVMMRILTPAGTPALQLSGKNTEAEVLLGRGLRLRVVADHGVDPKGVRHLDVEVLRD